MDPIAKRMMGTTDARSRRGMYSRGKAVYRQASHASKSGKDGPQEHSREAMIRRMKKLRG